MRWRDLLYRIDRHDRLDGGKSQHLRVRPVRQLNPCIGANVAYIVDNNIDTLNINTTTEDVGSYEDTLLESLELGESRNTTISKARDLTHRSGWGRAEWMQIEGKLHSCSKASSWVARATDLTKIQT